MNPIVNQWGPVAVIVVGYLLGIFFQNRRIDDLRDSMNTRFEDLRDLLKSEIKRLEERLGRMEGRLDHVDQRLDRMDQRLERLEHPTVRQG
jgi:chromosome segregation ATPase